MSTNENKKTMFFSTPGSIMNPNVEDLLDNSTDKEFPQYYLSSFGNGDINELPDWYIENE